MMLLAAPLLGYEPNLLDVVAVSAVGLWLLVVAAVRWARRPAEARVGARTLDLGPEPPAVANLLVHDFDVTREALPATLLDLAAHDVIELEHRGPGLFFCRLDPRADPPSTEYESRVLDLLRRRAVDGIVPPEALTTGPREASTKWWGAFRREVIDDCQRRGLSRDLWNRSTLAALTAIGLVPAPLLAAAFGWRVALGYVVVMLAFVGWLRSGRRQRETPAGLEVASRWLGVRSELRENEVLPSTPAITVALWERHLAYAAAFGLTGEASRLLGLEAESDTRAWSGYGGHWRRVRVRYPGLLPLGWGLSPVHAIVRGLVGVAVGVAIAVMLVPVLDGIANVVLLPAVLVAAAGALLVGLGLADARSSIEVTGPILRLRKRGSDKQPRYYVAVDEGSPTVRAWVVRPEVYATLAQDDVVTAAITPRLRHVVRISRGNPHGHRGLLRPRASVKP
jgi:predicted membrane protein DUF2207